MSALQKRGEFLDWNLLYLFSAIWLIVLWKTGVAHPRFFLGGLVILFGVAAMLAFAFLIGVLTSSTAVSLMVTYAIFLFAAVLAGHDRISAAVSSEWSAQTIHALYWIFPKTAELFRETVTLVSGGETFSRLAPINSFAVFGSTALFGLVTLGLAAWRFSRKDF